MFKMIQIKADIEVLDNFYIKLPNNLNLINESKSNLLYLKSI